jgi:hypothetical protein
MGDWMDNRRKGNPMPELASSIRTKNLKKKRKMIVCLGPGVSIDLM